MRRTEPSTQNSVDSCGDNFARRVHVCATKTNNEKVYSSEGIMCTSAVKGLSSNPCVLATPALTDARTAIVGEHLGQKILWRPLERSVLPHLRPNFAVSCSGGGDVDFSLED